MVFRVEIAGSLATGKSTLCKQLQDKFPVMVYEELDGNPYLDKVKTDPEQYALPCQEWFVDNKVNALRRAVEDNPDSCILSDFSLLADKAYVSHYLQDKPAWREQLFARLDRGIAAIGQPDVIVYLTCPPEEIIRRIKSRGRGFEQSLTVEFAAAINNLVQEQIDAAPKPGPRIMKIDTQKFDLRDPVILNALFVGIHRPVEAVRKPPFSAPHP